MPVSPVGDEVPEERHLPCEKSLPLLRGSFLRG